MTTESHGIVPRLIVATLRADPTVTAACESRIHYQTLPQTSKYPHIWITRRGGQSERMLDGSEGVRETNYVVEICCTAYDESLIDSVEVLLWFDQVTFEGVTVYTSSVDPPDDDYEIQSGADDSLFNHVFFLTLYSITEL